MTGQQSRWSVSPWGSVTPWGELAPATLDWYVAADDRWHDPSIEPTVRQQRIEGTPVVETRVRVPDGDAVQRVWAIPDRGGMVVIEFENESPMPFAVALAGAAVITERPVADVPIRGIELPADAIVMPVGHQSRVRVVLPNPTDLGSKPSLHQLPPVPPPLAVVRGWLRVVEQASRLLVPDERLVEAVTAARCDLLLEGPVDSEIDPAGFLLDVAELVRCGDSAEAWLLDVVAPAERLARTIQARGTGGRSAVFRSRGARGVTGTEPSSISTAELADAFDAAHLVARRSGDERAAADIARLGERLAGGRRLTGAAESDADQSGAARSSAAQSDAARSDATRSDAVMASLADIRRGPSVGRFVRSIERRMARDGCLLVGGIPTAWLGNNFEVHSVPTGPTTTVSYAVRWHGERPALLWEQHGDPAVMLSAPDIDPDWRSDAVSGEVLWPAPRIDRPKRASLNVTVDPAGGGSFA